MATTYPAKVDSIISLPLVVNNFTPISADTFNIMRGAVVAIQTELGAKPSGFSSTVRARMDSLETVVNNLVITGGGGGTSVIFAGDLLGNSISQQVAGLRGNAISGNAPSASHALLFINSAWTPSFITDASIDNAANINGSKIQGASSSNFGVIKLTGDISGTYSAIIVSKIQGRLISTNTPANSNILTWNNSLNNWEPSGIISINGSTNTGYQINNVSTTIINYTTTSTDYIISVGNISSSITITLPPSPVIGRTIWVKDSNGTAFTKNIIVDGNSKTIDGVSQFKINQNYASINFTYNGSEWMVI